MGLETPAFISDLVSTNPAAGDNKSEGDDHIRNLKIAIKATFPNVSGAVTPTHTELNYVDGVTSAIQTQLNAVTPTIGTFTATLATGATTTPTATWSYTLQGNLVVLNVVALSGTSDGITALTFTGIPAGIRPANNKTVVVRGVGSGTTVFTAALIGTTGSVAVYSDASATSFLVGSGGNPVGVAGLSVSYTLA